TSPDEGSEKAMIAAPRVRCRSRLRAASASITLGVVALALCLPAAVGLAADAFVSMAVVQVRVDQMRNGGAVRIGGDDLASTVVLPDFYERRGFQLAWTDEAARTDLLAALRESTNDGLEPRDYHLDALEGL